MPERPLSILHVSTRDVGGGAEKVAWNLAAAQRAAGHSVALAVGEKRSNHPDVFEIPKRLLDSATSDVFGKVRRRIDYELGREQFDFPGTYRLLDLTTTPPDVLHLHNLHVGYFDLRALTELSRHVPTFLTLHDQWLLTGHCCYSFECGRWEHGCGKCPDLGIYPAVKRDGTAYNWQRKRHIYAQSRLHVTTPSHWLMDMVDRSRMETVEKRVIRYGIDLDLYRPAPSAEARQQLGVPKDADVLLFVANLGRQNEFKDYDTIEAAMKLLAAQTGNSLHLFVLGAEGVDRVEGRAQFHHIPYQRDPAKVASYYQAADIFLHSAHADNFPNTILEALACGTPVVGTAIGGIPEQIINGETGLLVPHADPTAMAEAIQTLLQDRARLRSMSQRAAEEARLHYDLTRIADDHVDWYRDVLSKSGKTTLATAST